MLASYFTNLQKRSNLHFIIEVASLTILSRYLFVIPILVFLTLLGIDTGTPNFDVYKVGSTLIELFIELCLFGPLLETVLLQWLPLTALKFFKLPDGWRITIASLIFAGLHANYGIINVIGVLPIGYLLNWAFVIKQKESTWQAFFIVFTIHALANLYPFGLYILELLGDI